MKVCSRCTSPSGNRISNSRPTPSLRLSGNYATFNSSNFTTRVHFFATSERAFLALSVFLTYLLFKIYPRLSGKHFFQSVRRNNSYFHTIDSPLLQRKGRERRTNELNRTFSRTMAHLVRKREKRKGGGKKKKGEKEAHLVPR